MAFGESLLAGYSGSPERARWLHLALSGSQSLRAIWFILPAHGASHIIILIIIQQIVTLSKYGHDALDICHP